MTKTTHKKISKKSGTGSSAAKRVTKQSRTASKSVATRSEAAQESERARHAEKANAHLLEAWKIMYEIRTGKRKAKPPSLKWLKSLMTRTSL